MFICDPHPPVRGAVEICVIMGGGGAPVVSPLKDSTTVWIPTLDSPNLDFGACSACVAPGLRPIRGIELASAACSVAKPISIAASRPGPAVPSSIIVLGLWRFHAVQGQNLLPRSTSTSSWPSHAGSLRVGTKGLGTEQEQSRTHMFVAPWCCCWNSWTLCAAALWTCCLVLWCQGRRALALAPLSAGYQVFIRAEIRNEQRVRLPVMHRQACQRPQRRRH